MPGFPLLIDVRLLSTRTSTEVCDELEKMVAFFESLQSEGFAIGETCRVKRLHSDRAGEFTAPYFARFLANHKTIHHSFTSGYDPQSNGTAERSVGLIKSLAARCLKFAFLEPTYWSYAVRYAAQSLICRALQIRQRSLPFGSSVVALALGHQDIKFPQPRSITGRLLFWNHLHDQVSHILCPPEDDVSDPLVYRASLPTRLPPATDVDTLLDLQPLPSKKTFNRPLASNDDLDAKPKDLDPKPSVTFDLDKDDEEHEDDKDDDVLVELSHIQEETLPPDCPFSFLYLSSQDASLEANELDELTLSDSLPLPDDVRKQGTTHIPVTSDQILNSDGEERFKWMAAGRKELDNLSNTGTIEAISPDRKEQIKRDARSKGEKYIELPAKGVFSIKPDKYKVRIVACGNKTSEVYGKISTTDLDATMLRFLLSWGASLPDHAIALLT